MPADYKIDKSKRIVFNIAYGNLTDQDVFKHQDKLRNDPDFDPSFSQLVDCTNVTQIDGLSLKAISVLADRDPFGLGSQRAFVAPHNPDYDVFRLYELLTTVHEDVVVVFRDMSEAHDFLNLEL
ncbi:MAG: hypothetical protein WBG28_10175 [Desulfobulbales bacterium]